MKKLTLEFNEISLTRREVFQIELAGVPSAGFLWNVTVSEGEGTLLTERTVADMTTFGGPARQVFTFVANRPGTIVIDAAYARPWEQEPPAKTARFTIKVK